MKVAPAIQILQCLLLDFRRPREHRYRAFVFDVIRKFERRGGDGELQSGQLTELNQFRVDRQRILDRLHDAFQQIASVGGRFHAVGVQPKRICKSFMSAKPFRRVFVLRYHANALLRVLDRRFQHFARLVVMEAHVPKRAKAYGQPGPRLRSHVGRSLVPNEAA